MTGPGPPRAATVKVAEALMMLGSFVGIVTLADATAAASVPLSAVLAVELAAPFRPLTVTVIVVPNGMLEAASVTVTGLVVVPGRTTSGLANDAVGAAGAATPATAAIRSVGALPRVTGDTAPVETV